MRKFWFTITLILYSTAFVELGIYIVRCYSIIVELQRAFIVELSGFVTAWLIATGILCYLYKEGGVK